jgi:SAM-dependent methyltransferase
VSVGGAGDTGRRVPPSDDVRDPQRERDHFESILAARGALYWAERTAAGQRRRIIRSHLLAVGADAAGPAARVLEVGCGIGDYTRGLAAATVGSIVSVDVAPELVRHADADRPPNVRFLAADVEALPFASGTFDAVVGNAVLHHLRLERVVPEMLRVLRPGGHVCFAEPNMLNPQVFLERNVRLIGRLLDNSPGETAFVRWRIRAALERLGLEDVSARPFDFLYPLTPARWIGIVERLGRVLERVPGLAEIAGSLLIRARKPTGRDGC